MSDQPTSDVIHYDGTKCPEDCPCVNRQLEQLRAELAAERALADAERATSHAALAAMAESLRAMESDLDAAQSRGDGFWTHLLAVEGERDAAKKQLGDVFENLDLNSLNASLDETRAENRRLKAELADWLAAHPPSLCSAHQVLDLSCRICNPALRELAAERERHHATAGRVARARAEATEHAARIVATRNVANYTPDELAAEIRGCVPALAATAEPATPTYSADDLRKVAEATERATREHEMARYCYAKWGGSGEPNAPTCPKDLDLDAIIAKAVK